MSKGSWASTPPSKSLPNPDFLSNFWLKKTPFFCGFFAVFSAFFCGFSWVFSLIQHVIFCLLYQNCSTFLHTPITSVIALDSITVLIYRRLLGCPLVSLLTYAATHLTGTAFKVWLLVSCIYTNNNKGAQICCVPCRVLNIVGWWLIVIL